MRERLRLWWYNAVKRHWNDWRAGDGVKSGRITPATLEWARGYFQKLEN